MTTKNSSLIFAIDQGTSSSRVIVFRTSDWEVVALHQVEFDSLYPEEGWCEQDPILILQTVKEVKKTILFINIFIFLSFRQRKFSFRVELICTRSKSKRVTISLYNHRYNVIFLNLNLELNLIFSYIRVKN